MAAIPFFKLGALLVKQLAKPVATYVKREASQHPIVSQWTVALGQGSHRVTAQLNVLASGYKLMQIKPLDEKDALNRGAEIISETVIFVIGGTLAIVEYARQSSKSQAKEKKELHMKQQEQRLLQEKFQELDMRLTSMEEQIATLKHGTWGTFLSNKKNPSKPAPSGSSTPTTVIATPESSSSSSAYAVIAVPVEPRTPNSKPSQPSAVATPVIDDYSTNPNHSQTDTKQQPSTQRDSDAELSESGDAERSQSTTTPKATWWWPWTPQSR